MSTLEKLFVQIFERKNWIIDLVKQQTDLYDQYLASKLLIDGIRPPPWLLKGRFETGSSDLEELKKEEIISGLLIPPSRQKFPSSIGHGPLYNKTFVTLDNQQLSDGLLTETCASNKYLGGDKLAAVPKCRLNECEVGAIDGVPELDPTTTSPQDQKGARVSDTYYEPCHSLARIQRSRSRQKALELRNSVKGKRKQHPSKKFNAYPGRITRSRTACQQSNSTKELLELNKSSDIVNGSGGGVTHAKTEKCPTKENGTSAHSGRIARSRTSCRQSVRGTLELDKSSDITNGGVDRVTSLKSVSMQSNATGKSLQTSEPLSWVEGDNYFQNAQGSQADIPNSSSMPKDLEFYNCVETNAEQLSINGDISNKVIVRKARPQALQLNFVEGLLEPNNSSKIPSGRVTCSRSVSTGKSSQFAKSLKWIEGLDGDRAPGTHLVVPLCNDVNTINQEKYDAGIVETGLVSDVPDEACSICSGSNMHGASLRDGLEFLVSRLPSDISTFVEPKQLVFVDMEESVDPALEKEGQVGSSEMRPVTSLGPSESLEKANISNDLCEKHDSSVDEQLLEKEHVKEVANREKQARRISSEVQAEEKFEFDEIEKSKHHLNPTLIGKNSYLSAATSRKGTSEICEDAIADNSPDNNKTSKQGPSVTNDLITLQVGEKGSIGSQLPKAVDFIVPDVDVDPQMDRSCEKCNEEQDLEPRKIFPEDCKLETVTCNGHKGAVDTDFNSTTGFSLIRKPAMLLGAQETEISNVFASDATRRSVIGHTATPDAAQVNNAEREAPYYLRSSTSCDKNVGCSNSSGSRIVKKSIRSTKYANNALEGSWPQYKRRKLEDRSNNAFTDSPRLRRVKPVQKIYEDNECRDLKSVESDAEAVLDHHITCEGDVAQSNDTESLDVEMHQSGKLHKTERFEFSAKLQVNEGELKLEGRDQGANTILTLTHKQVESSLDSSLKKEANGDSQSCLKDRVGMENPTSFALDIKGQSPWENYQNLLHHEGNLNLGSTEPVGHTEGTMLESHLGEYGFLSYCAVSSPHTKGLDMIGADQNMPEFERFSIGSPRENNVPCFARNGISFDKSDLSSTITGQVSVLEQRYRSGSMLTPLSQVPTNFNLHTTPDIYQSLPNGLLKYMDLRSTMLSNDDNGNQRKHSYSGLSEEVDHTLGRSHSNCIPSSSVRFGWDVKRQPCTPPVGKFCQRITSNSLGGSSEKQENINPELTCFRIDEGPSVCEENGAIDEGDDPVQEGVHSVGNNSLTNIEPLGDVTIEYLNPSALVPSAEKSLNRGSLDSVNAGFNFSQTQMDVKQKLANCYGSNRRYKIEDKESQSSSLGGNGARKANDSLHNRFSKPISRKASEENGGRIFIEKGYKHNNIVSNISSFVPLVQQKQPAGILTGKRDIKVKALEAAEAARRFEEKRENERKKKKEAAKLERARMEQENMRQLELKQIKKEEERKKKEADMAARKRLREEEERKEKERKRKCIEEARRQQREHEEKLRVKKEEKEIRRRAADNREQKGKELAVEARKHQKMEKGREGASCGTKTDTEPRTAMVSTCTAREANNIHQDCQAPKESNDIENDMCNLNKVHEDNILITEGSREQSYEISPYQLSDDEDEEEDDIPNRKFIPSWASENCLAQILPSLKKIDPDEIFPLSSFCSIAEVLLPRLK